LGVLQAIVALAVFSIAAVALMTVVGAPREGRLVAVPRSRDDAVQVAQLPSMHEHELLRRKAA
jgi:hypothetical protein